MRRPSDWQQIEQLFHDALALAVTDRKAFLDRACHSPALRAELDSLLEAEALAGPESNSIFSSGCVTLKIQQPQS